MTLVQQLTGLSEEDQGALVRAAAEAATVDELLDALDLDPLGEWAMLHIIDELVSRGANIIAPVAERIAERPGRRSGYALAEALTEIFRVCSEGRFAVVSALVAAGEAGLRADPSIAAARTYVLHLADCARLAAGTFALPRALAAAFLERAGKEAASDGFAAAEASLLLADATRASRGASLP